MLQEDSVQGRSETVWDWQIQHETAFVQPLTSAATGCLLHYFFHMVCLPKQIFSIFLEQKFSWNKRSHQEDIYVCKVLWHNDKFCNHSNIHVLFLMTYLNLQSKQKARIVYTKPVRSQQEPLNSYHSTLRLPPCKYTRPDTHDQHIFAWMFWKRLHLKKYMWH